MDDRPHASKICFVANQVRTCVTSHTHLTDGFDDVTGRTSRKVQLLHAAVAHKLPHVVLIDSGPRQHNEPISSDVDQLSQQISSFVSCRRLTRSQHIVDTQIDQLFQCDVSIRAQVEGTVKGRRHRSRQVDQTGTVIAIDGPVISQSADHHAISTPLTCKLDIPRHDGPLFIVEAEITSPGSNEHVKSQLTGCTDALDHRRRRGRAADTEGLAQFNPMRSCLLGDIRTDNGVDTDLKVEVAHLEVEVAHVETLLILA
jgi:hypothetical protein